MVKEVVANRRARVLDLGCGDGSLSKILLVAGVDHIVGIDGDGLRLAQARRAGLQTLRADLNRALPLKDRSFDCAISQFSIEHLFEHDIFLAEVNRVLSPDGMFIVTTDNLSSWHNIVSLILGYRPMSMHYSNRYVFGNPLSPHAEESMHDRYPHTRIFTPRVLRRFLEIYGFMVEQIIGIGYVPFPPPFSETFAKADPTHAYFFTIIARKH